MTCLIDFILYRNNKVLGSFIKAKHIVDTVLLCKMSNKQQFKRRDCIK